MRGALLRLGTALSVAGLVVVGCGDDGDAATSATTTAAPETTVDASTTSVADDVQVLIVLNPDGLGFTTEDSGSVSRIDFGSDQQLTRDAVVKSLGEPSDEGTNQECAPGPPDFAYWDELQLYFENGTFAGWSIHNDSTLTTADGIGLGSTLDEYEQAYGDVTVEETSLGREFFDEAYNAGIDDNDRIDRLTTGTVCAFR